MTKDEALKLAKVCIQASLEYKRGNATAVEAVEDIDTMLAQPEDSTDLTIAYMAGLHDGKKQERALWTLTKLGQEIEAGTPKIGCVQHDCDECKARQQRPWVGLTEEEIRDCYKATYAVFQGRLLEVTFARAIEAKLKEKNT